MAAEKQNRILSIGASLGLHGLAAVILFFGMSGNAIFTEDQGKIDFVWASIAAKDKIALQPAVPDTARKPQPAAIKFSTRKELPETSNNLLPLETLAVADYVEREEGNAALDQVADSTPAAKTADFVVVQQSIHPAGAPAFSRAYPRYRDNPPPGYPETARERGYEGVVLIAAEILTDGRVGQVVVRQSSGYAILDQSAVKAVLAWKFEPAKKSGVPCKAWAELPIKFVINENNSQS